MGNRVIKESIKRSAEIDQLTWFEYACFINLIVTVDDYGRYLANPIILKNDLFPMKEDVTKKSIIDALDKLSRLNLIQIYNVDGKDYLQMTTWKEHQTIRNMKSKYPAPSENNCIQLKSIEINCVSNPIQSESNPNPNPNPTTTALAHDDELIRISEDHNALFDMWEKCGWQLNEIVMGSLEELYSKYGLNKVIDALKTTSEASAKAPMQYLRAVLSGKGKKPEQSTCLTKKVNAQAFTQRRWDDDSSDMDRMMEGYT